MRGILFTGGEHPEFSKIREWLKDAGVVVAADSGFDVARDLGVTPDRIVGDFDSVRRRDELDRVFQDAVERHPTEKDLTDTEIGLRALRELGATEIVIVGGGGGRLDHLIGILSLFDRADRPDIWLTAFSEVRLIRAELVLRGCAGMRVSFFPAGSEECRMESRGLRWPLDGLVWRRERGDVGISNVIIEDELRVRMLNGALIFVRDVRE